MIKSHEYEDQRRSVEQDQSTDDDLDPDFASRLGGSSSGSSELSPWLLTSLAGTFWKPSLFNHRVSPTFCSTSDSAQ